MKQRIEAGLPCFSKDLQGNYNPIEANLHSHFSKNYKYSKRGCLGSHFLVKIPCLVKMDHLNDFLAQE